MRKLWKIIPLLLASTVVHAHVGSPDVYYEGDAGPYHLFVTVRLPLVIPGVAELQVRSASPDVQSIQVVLLRLNGPGSNLSSVPDIAQRSKDDPQFFVANLWLMEFGALRVRIEADGSRGKAETSVPIASFARQSLPMGHGMRALGACFLLFLTLSVVPIIGAIVRESSLPPGEIPQPANRRRSLIAMGASFIVVVTVLFMNRTLWSKEASTYERNVDLLKPPQAQTTLLDGNRVLVIRPAGPLMRPLAGMGRDTVEVKMDELIPDHGHLMHLFIIGMPGMDTMWHLHPYRTVDGAFAERLPVMPAGRYQVFADITDKSGFPWTLVAHVQLPRINGTALVGDDTAWKGARLVPPVSETTVSWLPGGARMVWERADRPLKANVPANLNFRVEGKDGLAARDLEPYMGMVAHAEVVCSDLSVFAHLHPAGTVSMAALDLAQQPGASGMAMDIPSVALPPNFKFPYGFPHPGDYRIFVQIKRLGQVQSAAFDAHVN